MRKKGLIYKLLLTFSSISAGGMILVGILLSTLINREFAKQQSERTEKYIEIVEEATSEILNKNNEVGYEDLKSIMKIIKASMDMDSMIIDNQGYVYAVSDERLDYLKYSKLDIKNNDMKLLKSGEMIEYNFIIREDKVKTKAYLKPLFSDNNFNGIIILTEPLASVNLLNLYTIIWTLVVSAVILSSVLSYYFAKKILIKPLSQINNAAKKLAKGEVEKRVYIDSQDEIGDLVESFNIMAESLEKVDTVRREFISNVSHEIRSPITSIKGFVTGIIDGVIPRDRENYYLNIVNDEVSRLSRLVTDLLDISAMDSGKFKLNMTIMDINEIITLCTLNLEGKIKEKNIKVDVIFNKNYEYCLGDRDRIIQVVTNILENAIKYGKEWGGRIEIETYAKGDKVFVSIFNDGPNIPREDINKIWERFYKTDKSRTNKISTGLGLSIVRLILTQHNQDIWVNNIPDKGVKFIFTLKRQEK